MNNQFLLIVATLTFMVIGVCSCTTDTSYDETLDDLVLGIYFGMDKDEFFKHCWDLNQNGHAQHGSLNNNVMYYDSINFKPKVVINFYPKFVDNKISELPFSFYFKGWSPWNKHTLTQDKLISQVVDWFEKKYNTPFKSKEVNGQTVYYQIIGPLTIRVYPDIDEMLIKADIKHKYFMEKNIE